MQKRKGKIYRNDLKYNNNFDLDKLKFDSEAVESMYYEYSKKPKIELSLKDAELENYTYLDLSRLGITD